MSSFCCHTCGALTMYARPEYATAGRVNRLPGSVQIDKDAHRVERDGKAVALKPREYELLTYLLRHRSRVLTRTALMHAVWKNLDADERTVDVHVRRLREKLGKEIIRTVHGYGYQLGGAR